MRAGESAQNLAAVSNEQQAFAVLLRVAGFRRRVFQQFFGSSGAQPAVEPGEIHCWHVRAGSEMEAHDRSKRVGFIVAIGGRSEERRVGKECRSRWSPDH